MTYGLGGHRRSGTSRRGPFRCPLRLGQSAPSDSGAGPGGAQQVCMSAGDAMALSWDTAGSLPTVTSSPEKQERSSGTGTGGDPSPSLRGSCRGWLRAELPTGDLMWVLGLQACVPLTSLCPGDPGPQQPGARVGVPSTSAGGSAGRGPCPHGSWLVQRLDPEPRAVAVFWTSGRPSRTPWAAASFPGRPEPSATVTAP